jgi:hypothetical protein
MRYALRNQNKIKDALGIDFLNALINSLEQHFQTHPEIILETEYQNEPYPIIHVQNTQKNTDSVFELYVISIKFDVYLLAYKSCMS